MGAVVTYYGGPRNPQGLYSVQVHIATTHIGSLPGESGNLPFSSLPWPHLRCCKEKRSAERRHDSFDPRGERERPYFTQTLHQGICESTRDGDNDGQGLGAVGCCSKVLPVLLQE